LGKIAHESAPADADVLELLARAYPGLKKYEDAAKLYRRLVFSQIALVLRGRLVRRRAAGERREYVRRPITRYIDTRPEVPRDKRGGTNHRIARQDLGQLRNQWLAPTPHQVPIDAHAVSVVEHVSPAAEAVAQPGRIRQSVRDGLETGGGFADLEYALLRKEGKVREYTPILTTVHPLQIVDDRLPMRGHDIPVDFVVTPLQVIAAPSLHPRPRGVIWEILREDKIAGIPLLRKGRRDVRGALTPRRL
jgi:hypothetical protein